MRPRRILVVEDSLTQAERVRLLLEGEGYLVDVATDGREGLERVRSAPFDLIISDIVMPDMDGYAFCREVKSDPRIKWTPFIFLTQRKTAMDIIMGLAQGADNFIPKPFENDYLLQRIRRIFEHLELRTQGYSAMEVTLQIGDRRVAITSDKQQIIELLFSTYEELCELNARLNEQARTLEVKVQERTGQLHEAERKYRTLVEQLPVVTYIAAPDAHRTMFYISPQVEQLLGYSPTEWLSTPLLWSERLHPDDRQRVLTELAHNDADGGRFSLEYRLLRRDERTVWIRDEVVRVPGSAGQPAYIQGVMLDITEHKRVEAEVQHQREALYQGEKVSTMGQLLAGVAHELNNPLSVVRCYADLLRDLTKGGPLEERVEKVAQGAERCARIVKSFLALARQHPPERTTVHLNHIVSQAMELLAYPLKVDGVEVQIDLADELPLIWADPDQLHQVVVNLAANAHQALRESQSPRRLTMSTCYDPTQLRVFLGVADSGPGIPPDLQARLFEPFFTTKPLGQGTGLGLSLCQGIIEGHGGRIRVESAPGRGALFVVELPILTAPASTPEVEGFETPAALRARAILVVDDEPGVVQVLTEVLSIDGHRVDTASNGEVALKKLEEQDYDLILSDLRMPGLDGPGLYEALEHRYPALCQRIIFMTGDALTPATQAFLTRVTAPRVNKPFALTELQQAVAQMLKARSADGVTEGR
jgi:PAS domain S-box-containing protein